MSALTEKWRSYLSEHCGEDVERLADAYPDERSLYVDLIDLHGADSEFLRDLFSDPDSGFAAGRSVLRELTGVPGLVHLRVENNPQQRSVPEVGAGNVHGLVTVKGVVESVARTRASAVAAAYDCPVCQASVSLSQRGIDLSGPTRCDSCGWDGEFTFRAAQSSFVDLQEITLAPSAGDGRTLPAYLDDDIVGATEEGEQYAVTGILRVHRPGETNQFTLYLDALSVHEQRQSSGPETPDDVLDSHWNL